jgi:hypothetical protein
MRRRRRRSSGPQWAVTPWRNSIPILNGLSFHGGTHILPSQVITLQNSIV